MTNAAGSTTTLWEMLAALMIPVIPEVHWKESQAEGASRKTSFSCLSLMSSARPSERASVSPQHSTPVAAWRSMWKASVSADVVHNPWVCFCVVYSEAAPCSPAWTASWALPATFFFPFLLLLVLSSLHDLAGSGPADDSTNQRNPGVWVGFLTQSWGCWGTIIWFKS